MNERERAQVELIIDHELKKLKTDLNVGTESIYRKNNVRGLLQSGATIKGITDYLEITVISFLSDVAQKASAVSQDLESFILLKQATLAALAECAAKMPRLIQITGFEPDSPAQKAAHQRWANAETNVEEKLKIIEYDFEQVSQSEHKPSTALYSPPNRGGRPRNTFWEDMWAAIAANIINGDLDPKTQADLANAMLEWIIDNGHEASESSVRDRARKLWQLVR